MNHAQIGIIGGSGLYDMAEVSDRADVTLTTPFGDPSGPYLLGTLRGRRVAFLARHGVGHRLSPSELNFRANIFGFKTLGVEYILSASAVGSLKEEYKPLDIVIPDQFIDRTRGRISTFFGNGLVGHVDSPRDLRQGLAQSRRDRPVLDFPHLVAKLISQLKTVEWVGRNTARCVAEALLTERVLVAVAGELIGEEVVSCFDARCKKSLLVATISRRKLQFVQMKVLLGDENVAFIHVAFPFRIVLNNCDEKQLTMIGNMIRLFINNFLTR